MAHLGNSDWTVDGGSQAAVRLSLLMLLFIHSPKKTLPEASTLSCVCSSRIIHTPVSGRPPSSWSLAPGFCKGSLLPTRPSLPGLSLLQAPTFGGENFGGDFQFLEWFHSNIFQFNDKLLSFPVVKLDGHVGRYFVTRGRLQ